MVATLALHDDAVQDLNELRPLHPGLVRKILVTLQELKSSPDLLEILLEQGHGADHAEDLNVEKWQEQWKQGRDLWRLKLWQLEDANVRYRVIYAYKPADLAIYVLAVKSRSAIDYDDPEHPVTQRILRAYRGL